MGAGFSTVTPPAQSATSVAQTIWSYSPRSLTDIQNLTTAIQNNNPGAVPFYNDFLYVPVPYYAGQVTADQVAAFIDNAIRNYNLLNVFAGFITNNPYGLWTLNTVGDFLSSLYMSQTSVALLLAYAGATQMAQVLNSLSGNYTNVVIAFSLLVAPSTGANVLNNPNMLVTQAASIINNALISVAPSYPTSVAQLLSLVSSSVLANINAYSNVPATTLNQVISNAAMAATAAQAILYGLANSYYNNKWIYTVTANAGSTTISTNVTVVSPLYSQNLTVASGVTVTCGTNTCFFVAQSFNNYGTIVSQGATGAPSPGADIGNGGTGGGGIVVIAVTSALGPLNVAGSPGGVGSSGATASVSGGGGGAGVFYVVTGVVVPVGGSGAGGGYAGAAGVNGGGGGGSGSYHGGGGGSATLNAFASANSMLTYIMQGLSDWWLINILGKVPSSTTPLAYMYGSGGGAGAGVAVSGNAGGGGGGGGGGEVVVYGFNIVSGTINAVGGTGGGSPENGGGGGGGGFVFVFYGATSGNITASVNGGIGGDIGGTGLAGANGKAYIAQVTVNG